MPPIYYVKPKLDIPGLSVTAGKNKERKKEMDWSSIISSLISAFVVLIGYIIVDRREKNKQMEGFRKEMLKTLEEHRKEYLEGIEDVKDSVTDMKAIYQQNTAIVELKIESLEKKQDQHNNLISRMYAVESQQKLQEEQIKVANHRIEDLEKK